jgi:hypothetical protein
MRIWIWIVGFVFSVSSLKGLPTVVPDPVGCVEFLETHFFDQALVNQALNLYQVRQELWLPINQLLQVKSIAVPERMKQRTAFLVPNPLEYPMQKGATAKILKEVLYQVFYESLTVYASDESSKAPAIFGYIFAEQFPMFVRCFGDEAQSLNDSFLFE